MSSPEKIEIICPKCGTKNEVLWFSGFGMVYRIKGTTGASGNKFVGKCEKVEGQCKDCGYKFKAKDLD